MQMHLYLDFNNRLLEQKNPQTINKLSFSDSQPDVPQILEGFESVLVIAYHIFEGQCSS